MLQSYSIPENFRCPITLQIMAEPVIALDGFTYEKEAIQRHLKRYGTSPTTGAALQDMLIPNYDKLSIISEFLGNRCELYEGDEIYLPESWVHQFVATIKQNQRQEVQRWVAKDRRLLTMKLENDSTALYLACEFSSPELIDILLKTLKQKNQPILPDARGFKLEHLNVLLQRALEQADYTDCELLLRLGADIEQPTASTQDTLLHRMVINGNQDAISWLIEHKAVLESCNNEGNTALLLSVIHTQRKITEFLLKKNASLKAENREEKTAFYIAIEKEDTETEKLFLTYDSNPIIGFAGTRLNDFPVLAFRTAVQAKHMNVICLLLETIAQERKNGQEKVEIVSEKASQKLQNTAIKINHSKVTIAKGGTDVNKPNDAGWTPMHIAARGGDAKAIGALKAAGAVVDALNQEGATPLYIAAHNGHLAAVAALLEAGADAGIKTGWGTVLEIAKKGKKPDHPKIIKLLKTHFTLYQNGIKPKKKGTGLQLLDIKAQIEQSQADIAQGVVSGNSSALASSSQTSSLPIHVHTVETASNISSKDAAKFLTLVTQGGQDIAEAMLKKHPALALVSGDVRDLSKRTFKGITGFQYAVWALDWHMWTMIRRYLPDEVAREQAQGFEMGSWVKSHGIHARPLLENLVQALQFIIGLYDLNRYSANTDWVQQANTAWVQQVGSAQFLLPAHVINEYCHPKRPFYPIPNFRDTTTLPRIRIGGEWEWFTALSVGCAWGRNGGDYACAWPGGCAAYSVLSFDLDPDSIRELSNTRTAQREELIAQLSSRNTQQEVALLVEKLNLPEQKNLSESRMLAQFQGFIKPASRINASDLTAFLRFVAEGEQDKAEAMLKSNSALALASGDVRDLSGRTFTGITAFQYAVWALDWHMWRMIRKYLSIEDSRLQAQGFETGHWVKSHGVHAQKLLDDLIKAYKTAIDFHKVSKMNEYSKAWKRLGGFQFLLPVHVINEYCHPTRPFYPIPNFKDTLTLPRNRTINGINADNNEGDCFTFLYHDSNTNGDAICRSTRRMAALGPRLVLYQTEHGCIQCEAMETDYESICAFTSIRTAQHKELVAELRAKKVQKCVA